jgi:D-alanyl-D-alanine carboxypeptidase/D-alanyl-D-alanine-endopeptidase (penicillin-binding protein 4)
MTGTFYGRVHSDPLSRLLILLCGLCLLGVTPASADTLTPTGLAALQSDLHHQLLLAGPHDGAYVYDITAKQALFSERATALRPPASVEKLFTATAALERMGPTATLETTVLGAGRLLPGGVWEGNIYLH